MKIVYEVLIKHLKIQNTLLSDNEEDIKFYSEELNKMLKRKDELILLVAELEQALRQFDYDPKEYNESN